MTEMRKMAPYIAAIGIPAATALAARLGIDAYAALSGQAIDVNQLYQNLSPLAKAAALVDVAALFAVQSLGSLKLGKAYTESRISNVDHMEGV